MKKPRATIASVSKRLDAMEKQERGFASAAMMHAINQHLSARNMQDVDAIIRKEMDRIKAEILEDMRYHQVSVDVRHTFNGEPV